jgi:hypothetical protein
MIRYEEYVVEDFSKEDDLLIGESTQASEQDSHDLHNRWMP